MDRQKSIVIRDFGGFLLGWVIVGLPLGIPVDLAWNWAGLRLSAKLAGLSFARGKTVSYCLMITAIGLWVDVPYVRLLWGVDWTARNEYFAAEFPFMLQLASIVLTYNI